MVALLLSGVAEAGSSQAVRGVQADSASTPTPETASDQSEAVATLLRWVNVSGDNQELPFIVIDKVGAKVLMFDAKGKLLGSAPVLIGIGRGDDTAPGVGNVRLGKIPIGQRTTPAGRFIARFGRARGHPPVLWVDYANAIALHPVVSRNTKERRLQRIKSADSDDHRISFGCINVPASFYTKVVKPQFKSKSSSSVVYILPDTKKLTDVFPGIMLQAPTLSSTS